MNYALIENGVVTNIIWLHPGNAADFPSAAPIGDIPAAIGDVYTDGVFYRDGERVLTAVEQAVADVLAEIEEALNA
jgi:hypothetical protein